VKILGHARNKGGAVKIRVMRITTPKEQIEEITVGGKFAHGKEQIPGLGVWGPGLVRDGRSRPERKR